jgi:hydroxypyruvate isomerase
MIKLSSCIEMMFTEFPFEQRFAKAAEVGFAAAEFWGWPGKDLQGIAEASKAAGIPLSVCCVGTADGARGAQYGQGAMLVKQNAGLYAEIVEETIEAVSPLGIRTLIATTGQELAGVGRQSQQDAIVECLKAAVPVLEKHGFSIVLEPLNILVNHKGYYLSTSAQAFDILRSVSSPKVKLLYDIYHQQITEGNLIQTVTENIGRIGHFHLADVPGRHEPGTGEINYRNVFAAINTTDFTGYVGCEYSPSKGKTTIESTQEILKLAALFNK